MAGRIPERFVDELLARSDIVELIQERVPLRRAGRDWTACCPFHDERTPSFTVSPSKQFYHCFGCGAHGSAIGFLMNYDRLEFPDAVEELARRAGLEVPREGGRGAPREDSTDLYAILDEAVEFYRGQLTASASARDYFAARGLDEATLARFRLGYAPEAWDALRSAFGGSARRMALLEQAGLLSRSERGSQYDRFRARVMFPILDRRGRPIAFGGRVLAGAEGAKYLNSPETPLFHKGRQLFGLWQVREANARIARLIVVEGYMDVIALHQAGISQAVATLGTATTPEHAELLFRQTADVFFCFDGDRAGRQAAWRALEAALPQMREGRQARFLFLPEGEDPDSLVRREGSAGFERRLTEAVPLGEFLLGELGRETRLDSVDGRARLAERARPLLARMPDGAFRDLMLDELERRSGLRLRFGAAPAPAARRSPQPPRSRSLVRAAITLLAQYPALASDAEPPWPFAELRQPGVSLLLELLETCRAQPGLSSAALLERYAEREEGAALRKLAVVELPEDESALAAEFADALTQLARQARQQRREELIAAQAAGRLDEEGKQELRALLAARAKE